MSLKTHASQANKGIQISVRSKHGGSFELQLRPNPRTIEISGLWVVDPESGIPAWVNLQIVGLCIITTKMERHITFCICLGKRTVDVEIFTNRESILVVHRQRPKSIIAIRNVFERQRLRLG